MKIENFEALMGLYDFIVVMPDNDFGTLRSSLLGLSRNLSDFSLSCEECSKSNKIYKIRGEICLARYPDCKEEIFINWNQLHKRNIIDKNLLEEIKNKSKN